MFILVSSDPLPVPQGLPCGNLYRHCHHPLIISDRMADCVLGTGLRAHNIQRKDVLLPARVLSLLQLIEIDSGPDKKFRQGFIGAPAEAGGGGEQEETTCSLVCSFPKGR